MIVQITATITQNNNPSVNTLPPPMSATVVVAMSSVVVFYEETSGKIGEQPDQKQCESHGSPKELTENRHSRHCEETENKTPHDYLEYDHKAPPRCE